jgi:hypothetical protein
MNASPLIVKFCVCLHPTSPLVSSGMTRADARRFLLSAPLSSLPSSSACNGSTTRDQTLLPSSFDARVQWPNLFHASPDPGQCDPIAFVSATIFSDVVSIARNAKLTFSVQELLSCGSYDCESGNWPNKAFLYMTEKGLPSDACYPLDDTHSTQARERATTPFSFITRLFSVNPSVPMAAPKLRAPSGCIRSTPFRAPKPSCMCAPKPVKSLTCPLVISRCFRRS